MSRVLFCCLVAVAILPQAAAEPAQIDVHGQVREYLLKRPAAQDARPTVVMLHGGGSSAEHEAQLSDLAELGQREGFVAVFPEGRGKLWNFFPPGTENPQYLRYLDRFGGLPDDVAFLKLLVADLIGRGISDPSRIYLAGRSLGGVMALRLTCVDGSFAALGLLTSAMPEVTGAQCEPPHPVPVLIINGTEDRVLAYRGERTVRGDIVWSTQRLVTFLRERGGCEGAAQRSDLSGSAMRNVVIERWTNCAAGPVVLYHIVGGGHDVPVALNATQRLLDFFRDKAR